MKYCIFFTFFFSFSLSFAQSPEECKARLVASVKKSLEKPVQKKGKYYRIEMEIESVFSIGSGETGQNKQSIKSVNGENFVIHETPEFSLFQDGKYAFVVIHKTKEIFWMPPQELNAKTDNPFISAGQLPDLQLKLVETGLVKNVSDTLFNGKNLKIVHLLVAEDMKNFVNFEKIKYYYDLEKDNIDRYTIIYKPNYKFQQQHISILNIDNDYKAIENTNAKSYVLNAYNQLLPQYNQYKLTKIGIN